MFDIINLSLSVVTFFLYLSILTSSGTVICILLFKLTDAKKIVILFGYLGLISSIFGFALKGANLTGDFYGMITEADFFASMVGESGSAASISHDPENQLTTGSDGGIFAPTFKYKTTDW